MKAETASDKFTLYAVKTFGSAIVELVFEFTDLPLEAKFITPEEVHTADYKSINPLEQIPSLRLPSGEIMTESLAICLYINEKGKAGLAPLPTAPEYPSFLRWSVFLTGSIYSLAPYCDHPDWYVKDKEAQTQLKEASMNKLKERFLLMEDAAKAPWFLGEKLSLIDLYLSVMTYWEPRREWFEAHCPKIMKSVARFQTTPEFKSVFAHNEP